MSNSIEARYQIIQERTLPVIASEIIQIDRTISAIALDGAIQIGRKLQEAKELVPEGEWLKWLEENLNYSKSQAFRFIQVSNTYGNKESAYFEVATSRNLSISKAFELLRLPDEEVKTFAESHDIESETVKDLRREITELKAEKEAAERKAEMIDHNNDDIRKELASMQRKLSEAVSEKEFGEMQEDYERRVKALNEELNQVEDDKAGVQEKLDKAKADLKKAKEKLKESEAAKDEEIQKRLAEAGAELEEKIRADTQKEAENELKEKADTIQALEEQVSALEAEKAKLSNTSLMEFKVMVDQLQDVYFKINDLITEQNEHDPELGLKMQNALQKLIEGWRP